MLGPLLQMITEPGSCSLYYKYIMIINDNSKVVNEGLESLIDDVSYDRNMFIIQDTDVPLYFHSSFQIYKRSPVSTWGGPRNQKEGEEKQK
jgi:hypothetical protein